MPDTITPERDSHSVCVLGGGGGHDTGGSGPPSFQSIQLLTVFLKVRVALSD